MPPQQENNNQPVNQQPRKIEGFNPKEYTKTLAMEASQVIPPDIQENDRNFIVELVHKFCLLCGDSLVKDEKYDLNAQQVSIITQFIGEWTYHKSIDLIRGGIGVDLREGVLQKVAFTVFEIAKQAISRNLPQDQVITVIENQVKNCFHNAIEELKKRGKINEDTVNNTLSQSSIDQMSQQQFENEQLEKNLSDTKILKLAALALFIKKLPEEKANEIISKFNKAEAQVLSQYLQIANLDQKVNKESAIKWLSEIKSVLPEPKIVSMDRVYAKLYKIVKTGDKNKISNIIDNERPLIKQFVMAPYTKEMAKIPSRVGSVICKYLEEKLSSNDN